MCTFSFFCSFRNIGRLGRSIKNRRNPAANLVAQYKRTIQAFNLGCDRDSDDEEPDQEALDDEDPIHPLLPMGKVTSFTEMDEVVWPQLTRWTSFKRFTKLRQEFYRPRVLFPVLGAAVCAANRGLNNSFTFVEHHQRVRIGSFVYSCSSRETDDRFTSSSWFSMKLKHLPHECESEKDNEHCDRCPEGGVFGRIHHFVCLTVPNWKEEHQVHHLALCTLYFPQLWSEEANLLAIHLDHPVRFKATAGSKNCATERYINVKHINTQVAHAPAVEFVSEIGLVADPTIRVVMQMFK